MVSTRATVLRDGQRTEIESAEVVPGDIVLLESGDVVPADLRLVEATRLECDEAMLTGESVPVGKIAEPIVHDGPLPDPRSARTWPLPARRSPAAGGAASWWPPVRAPRWARSRRRSTKPSASRRRSSAAWPGSERGWAGRSSDSASWPSARGSRVASRSRRCSSPPSRSPLRRFPRGCRSS